MSGVLEGVRVLEVGGWGALPLACAILADWGAEVIKVENPQGGDGFRGLTTVEGTYAGDCWWHLYNRGKKSLALDLRAPGGREVLDRLVPHTDILVTNLRPAALEKYRLDYETLRSLNPGLIYGRLTGYGTQGPDAELPGFDYSAFWARSGIMDRVSEPGRAPRPIRPGLGDNTTSLAIAGGLSAALFRRERTGMGQEVHFSLYHSAVWALAMDLQAALTLGHDLPHNDRTRAANPLWNTYETQDGRWIQLAILTPDRYWPNFSRAVERPHLQEDPRYATTEARAQHCQELVKAIGEIMAQRPLEEWERRFREHDVIHARVQRPSETLEDPQAWANEFFVAVNGPERPRTLVNSPVRFRGDPSQVNGVGPELGQHTEEVLLELARYSWEELEVLKDAGAIPR